MRQRLVVDFDGTCVGHDFPAMSLEVPGCVEVLRTLVARGYTITLNTMRSGTALDEAVQWFKERHLPLYGVNQDPAQKAWTESPKVDGDFYIDDKGLGCPMRLHVLFDKPVVDWECVLCLIDLKERETHT